MRMLYISLNFCIIRYASSWQKNKYVFSILCWCPKSNQHKILLHIHSTHSFSYFFTTYDLIISHFYHQSVNTNFISLFIQWFPNQSLSSNLISLFLSLFSHHSIILYLPQYSHHSLNTYLILLSILHHSLNTLYLS